MRAWVVRDKNGTLWIFTHKPTKVSYADYWVGVRMYMITEQDLPEGINPQWTDAEPTEIELKIEKV